MPAKQSCQKSTVKLQASLCTAFGDTPWFVIKTKITLTQLLETIGECRFSTGEKTQLVIKLGDVNVFIKSYDKKAKTLIGEGDLKMYHAGSVERLRKEEFQKLIADGWTCINKKMKKQYSL